jgi:ring-1,2-phenylacetyl-CoA epoxidase subunit PaaE
MSQFKKLKVKDIRTETKDTVSISFEIPIELKAEFNYQSGQYITIQKKVDGEDIRRAYSLCSSPLEDDFRIGVKKINEGKMSSHLNLNIKIGEELNVLPPSGNFKIIDLNSNAVGFASGSGITPLLSMVKSVLNSNGHFTLYYGNKTSDETIFKNELDELQILFPDNFKLYYIYSRENIGNSVFEGRIDKEKMPILIKENIDLLKADGFYLCGPEEMVKNVSETLGEYQVNEDKIHFELFTAPVINEKTKEKNDSEFSGESQVTTIMDGDEFNFNLKADGDFILDAAIDEGVDAPFSCKGAVCCTCKAKVIEGKAIMELNYSLSDAEVEDGYILTCQAHPASEKLIIDYDVT